MPLAQVNLIVLGPAAPPIPIGKYGVGSLTAAMLDEGAGSRSALELADAIEFLGANLSTTSSFDSSAVRLLGAGGEAWRRAAADGGRRAAADVPGRRARSAAQGAADRTCCRRATTRRRSSQLAFPAHRLRPDASLRHAGNGSAGGDQGLHASTICSAFYRAHYRPDNATLLVVGDVTPRHR